MGDNTITYNDLPGNAVKCGPSTHNEAHALRVGLESFEPKGDGKGDGKLKRKETNLSAKDYNDVASFVQSFKGIFKKNPGCIADSHVTILCKKRQEILQKFGVKPEGKCTEFPEKDHK